MRVRVDVYGVFGLTYENEKHTQPKGCATLIYMFSLPRLPTGIGPGPLVVGSHVRTAVRAM